MNNSNFCGRCGKPLAAGQQFCDGCGTPVNAAPAKSAAKPKRKTYTAQKFISMGFAIGDIIFAISFFLCGIVFEALAQELMKEARKVVAKSYWTYGSQGSYNEYKMMAETYELSAKIMYGLAVFLLLASVLCWIFFIVYSVKRKKVYAEIALEKQNEENARRREEMLRARMYSAEKEDVRMPGRIEEAGDDAVSTDGSDL